MEFCSKIRESLHSSTLNDDPGIGPLETTLKEVQINIQRKAIRGKARSGNVYPSQRESAELPEQLKHLFGVVDTVQPDTVAL